MRAQRAHAAAWVALALLSSAALVEGLKTSSSATQLRHPIPIRSRIARPTKAFWTLNVNGAGFSGGEVLQRGEALSVVGSLDELGGWDVDSAVQTPAPKMFIDISDIPKPETLTLCLTTLIWKP